MPSGLRLLNLIQIVLTQQSYDDHIDFSRWLPRRDNFASDFVFGDFTQWRKSKSTCIPNFYYISQFTIDILLLSIWKQTSAMLELCSRFRFSRLHHYRHVILHLTTIFRPNRTIHDIVMTSFPFFKMAATASQFYFRFRFSWVRSFGKVEISLQLLTKFQRYISIQVEILLLPVFGNKRPPCWNSTPGFDFHVCITIGMSFCISLPWAGLSAVELWRHSYFQDGGHQPCWILSRVIADHPRSTKEGHWRRKGGKETCAPGGTVQRSAFGGAKIWNYEIWSFLSNCICIADSDISHP